MGKRYEALLRKKTETEMVEDKVESAACISFQYRDIPTVRLAADLENHCPEHCVLKGGKMRLSVNPKPVNVQ